MSEWVGGSHQVGETISLDAAAQLLHLSRRTLERARKRGLLPDADSAMTLDVVRRAPLLRLGKAADHAGLTWATMRRWARQKRLRVVMVEGEMRTSLFDLEAALGRGIPLSESPPAASTETSLVLFETGRNQFTEPATVLAGDIREDSSIAEILPRRARGKRSAEAVGTILSLEPEKSERKRPGGWISHQHPDGGLLRVFAEHRAYVVIEAWLERAKKVPNEPCRFLLQELAHLIPESEAAQKIRSGERITFSTLHGIMSAVRRVLAEVRVRNPHARVESKSYEFPPLLKCAELSKRDISRSP